MALTTLPSAGSKLRASVLQSLIAEVRTVYGLKASDQNVGPSNTTLQNVTDIAVAVEASATYAFALSLQYTTTTAADIKLGWTYPTGLTMDYALEAFNTSETWVTSRGDQTSSLGFGGTGTSAYLNGTVTVSSTAGTLQLQAAQFASTAVTTSVDTGTLITLRRIA